MLRLRFFPFLLGCGLLLTGCYSGMYMHRSSWAHRERDSVAVMTNQDVIAMSKSGVKESVIMNLVKRAQPAFQLGPDDVIALSDSGVSEKVINSMIKAQDEGPAGGSNGGYAYSPYYYSWSAGYPWWYWGYAWDPWFYYPSAYYSWYGPHYYNYGFRNYGFRNYGFHNYGFSGHSYAPRGGYSGGSDGGGGRTGGHRR